MLKQAIEVFEKQYKLYGDKLILDEYVPDDGTYVIVNVDKSDYKIEKTYEIKYDKNLHDIDRSAIIDDIEFICLADYNSKLIHMNKPIDTKKIIHSNNYMSFFMKKDNLTSGKLTNEIIENYYNILKNPSSKYNGKKKSLELYKLIEQEIGQPDIELIDKIELWIKENLHKEFDNITGKGYLKIFFKFSNDDYIREEKRYLIPNIFNSNDTNILIDEKVYGLPSNNIGLNSKKPYLENKTRKNIAPYLISQDDVIIQKKFFDYLMNKASVGKCNIYINDEIIALENDKLLNRGFKGIYLRIIIYNDKTKQEAKILDYDIITHFSPDLDEEFNYKNVLGVDYDKLKGTYKKYKTLDGMQKLINEIFFDKKLIYNYFTDISDINIKNNNELLYNLALCRNSLFDWFYKGKIDNVWTVLNIATQNLIKNSILKGFSINAQDQFNLRLSLKEYFEGGENMADKIMQIKQTLREKISQKVTGYIENDDEYFFAVGQIAFYLISRNKGKKKPLSLAKPFINAKNDTVIKSQLRALYKKYDYDIESYATKFKNLYGMVAGYEIDGEVNSDMIIAGYIHSNLLYENSKKDENLNEDIENMEGFENE